MGGTGDYEAKVVDFEGETRNPSENSDTKAPIESKCIRIAT